MRAFVTPCLAAVEAEPDKVLKLLARYWPAPKTRCRPPRSATAQGGRSLSAVPHPRM